MGMMAKKPVKHTKAKTEAAYHAETTVSAPPAKDEAGVEAPQPSKLRSYFPQFLVASGLVGLFASLTLMVEKLAVLKDPNYIPSCNINPIIACGSVINTDQASAFGFPNPLIGIFGFGAVLVVGVSLLAGMKITKTWYWRTFWAGTLFGVLFVHWLFFQSVYRIEALCPYCVLVWVVTIAVFWYSTLWMLREGYLALPKSWARLSNFLQRNHMGVLICWYTALFWLIMSHFWYYFSF
jgi:uncharacterized membrane protein